MYLIFRINTITLRDINSFIDGKTLLILTMIDFQALEEIIDEPVDYYDQPIIFSANFNAHFLL